MKAPPFARFDPKQPGTWYNASQSWGYRLENERQQRGRFYRITGRTNVIYDYMPIYIHPMYYQLQDGVKIAAGPFEKYDGGSVPVPFQRWLPKDGSHAYPFHDHAYKTGGLFFLFPGEAVWTFRQVTRAQADMLLRTSAYHDINLPMTKRRAKVVWMGVCSFRPFSPNLFHVWKMGDEIPLWDGGCPEEDGTDPAGGYGGG